ncbi:MAG: arsenate reductase (glutaredoxin) [Pseudomonadales bacterium]|nr:arsenate reductase (glutaredoxin) [Pseudomonadales bacterium]MDP7360492.1 arsenate reductase (glutaredoxin) [Pseudomonadales bacterium]MDP7594411.1 arsenate reductase (glutaredoxin) [Pseudomonadales bacterium]HJN50985.1 arsenate reductase (glutaredoxin) [Pseudomonadales bacterium]
MSIYNTKLFAGADTLITMYHNPNCSKSRATLELLNERGVEPEIRLYLDNPPSLQELADLARKLQMDPTQFIRFNEEVAKERNISATDDRDASEWLTLMSENPILIERPIVIAGDRARIGRPPENVLELI